MYAEVSTDRKKELILHVIQIPIKVRQYGVSAGDENKMQNKPWQ
jgi:hypothetical protein